MNQSVPCPTNLNSPDLPKRSTHSVIPIGVLGNVGNYMPQRSVKKNWSTAGGGKFVCWGSYVLVTYMVKSMQVPTCNRVHSCQFSK